MKGSMGIKILVVILVVLIALAGILLGMKMMKDNEIEVLDIEEDVKVIEENEDKVDEVKEIRTKKTRRLKKGIFQTIFCFVSLIFIIGCCIFYGSRLIKYYKIYNPKSESGEAIQLISNALVQDTPIVFEGSPASSKQTAQR